jgi:hypothetical protein
VNDVEERRKVEGLSIEELEAQRIELLPDREEMQAVFQNQQQFQAFNINPNQAALGFGVAVGG